MSFLSILGKIGKGALNVATGGVGGSVLDALGSVSGSAAKGSADQRLKEAQLGLQNQQLLQSGARDQFQSGLSGAGDQFSADLRSAEFNRGEQDRQRKAAMLMQLLNNTQDLKITPGNPNIAARMATVTGGARPSNLTTNREALLQLLMQAGPAAPVYRTPAPYQAPSPYQLPTQGAGEKILGGIGLGSSILGALSPWLSTLGRRGGPNTGYYDPTEGA